MLSKTIYNNSYIYYNIITRARYNNMIYLT